ncbi:head-tail connector protein [Staphylococcus equorum]|uniref:Head-tail connector protein n=1 Tax=Staphylococcus equorum TaxID=246432 RepID=A0A9X4R2P0_9STAP|nr:head-tail connector protein [Staphylococcus equorum]MDG0860321.1 head-tail connector protein [Staphylococcus equorum]
MIPTCKVNELSLQDAKGYMRVEFNYDDPYIEVYLNSAKSYIQTLLKLNYSDFGDDIPQELTVACLALTEHWYKNKGIEKDSQTTRKIIHNFEGIIDAHRDFFGVDNL